jgi:hypothetical protein
MPHFDPSRCRAVRLEELLRHDQAVIIARHVSDDGWATPLPVDRPATSERVIHDEVSTHPSGVWPLSAV